MSQDEFERAYAQRSDLTLLEFRSRYIGLRCGCGDADCEGWAAVDRSPESIEAYVKLNRQRVS